LSSSCPTPPTPLQDPSDKSFILADDTLKALAGEERFKGFSFSKYIKDHIRGYAD
jgi:chromatin remodeling complex protein RSC6